MNRIALLNILAFFISLNTTAQDFENYGRIDQNEVALKICEFDKDANAVVLINEAYSNYNDDRNLITHHHKRIKILSGNGFSAADITIPFYRKNDFEFIYNIEGMTINTDEFGGFKKIPLEKKSIYTNKVNEWRGEMVFTFPAIKAGSIIDFKYTSQMKHYGGLEEWSFQEELPVMKSKYSVVIVPNTEFTYRVNKTLDIPLAFKKLESTGGIEFEMLNLPGLGQEPFMDARKDYLQKVIFQLSGYERQTGGQGKYMTSWKELANELMQSPEFGVQLGKNIEGTSGFLKEVASMLIPEEKMKSIFSYVRSNMGWNGFTSIYTGEGIKAAWKKKSGTSSELNMVLINLLKEAGLEAYPMLVSERYHGKVNTSYPFLDQFNTVFACVFINGRQYYLDATNETIPPHVTPSEILNTTALIIKKRTGELINITNDTTLYQERIEGDIQIAADGTVSGEIMVKSYDYARLEKLKTYKKLPPGILPKYYDIPGTSIGIKDFKVNNLQQDSLSFDQTLLLTGSLNSTGEYQFLPLNIFMGFDANPFVAVNRFSNINFGYRRSVFFSVNIKLADGLEADEIPKSIQLTNPDKDIEFIRQLDYLKKENTIVCLMQVHFKKSLYEPVEYDMLKEIYAMIMNYLKQPVVLKKKAT